MWISRQFRRSAGSSGSLITDYPGIWAHVFYKQPRRALRARSGTLLGADPISFWSEVFGLPGIDCTQLCAVDELHGVGILCCVLSPEAIPQRNTLAVN
jgi:hypothetical protein